MVNANLIAKFPVIFNNMKSAYAIWSQDQEEKARKAPERVHTNYIHIPQETIENHKYVTLTAHQMFVYGLAFLITTIKGLDL